ncbi:MAG: hypothetical protein Q9187_009288 [Circinaria calcarea]
MARIVEINVAIICSSMPAVVSFLKLTISKSEHVRSDKSSSITNREDGHSRLKSTSDLKPMTSPGSLRRPDPTLQLKDDNNPEFENVQGKITPINSEFNDHVAAGDSEHRSADMREVAEPNGILKSVGVDNSSQDHTQ